MNSKPRRLLANKSAVVPFPFVFHVLGIIVERTIFAVPEFTRITNDYILHFGGCLGISTSLGVSIKRTRERCSGIDIDVTEDLNDSVGK